MTNKINFKVKILTKKLEEATGKKVSLKEMPKKSIPTTTQKHSYRVEFESYERYDAPERIFKTITASYLIQALSKVIKNTEWWYEYLRDWTDVDAKGLSSNSSWKDYGVLFANPKGEKELIKILNSVDSGGWDAFNVWKDGKEIVKTYEKEDEYDDEDFDDEW